MQLKKQTNILCICRRFSEWQTNRSHSVPGRCLGAAPVCWWTAHTRRTKVIESWSCVAKTNTFVHSCWLIATNNQLIVWGSMCVFLHVDCLCHMHLMLCLRARSWAFTSSGVRSLASLLPLITQPTSPWRWPSAMPTTPVASVGTSTLFQLMSTLLKRVGACEGK